jgi:hypothetical protein
MYTVVCLSTSSFCNLREFIVNCRSTALSRRVVIFSSKIKHRRHGLIKLGNNPTSLPICPLGRWRTYTPQRVSVEDGSAGWGHGTSTHVAPISVSQQQHSRDSGQQMRARHTARKKPMVGPCVVEVSCEVKRPGRRPQRTDNLESAWVVDARAALAADG